MILFFLLYSNFRLVGHLIVTIWTEFRLWSHILDMGTAVFSQKLKYCKDNVSFVCLSIWRRVGWMQRWFVTRLRQKDVRMSLVFHFWLKKSKLFSVILDSQLIVNNIFQFIKAESMARVYILVLCVLGMHQCSFMWDTVFFTYFDPTPYAKRKDTCKFLILKKRYVYHCISLVFPLCAATGTSAQKFPHDKHVFFLFPI